MRLVGPICVIQSKSIQFICIKVGIRYELMVEEIRMCNSGKLRNEEEEGSVRVCEEGSLPEVPSFVEESLLKRHSCI